MFNTPKPKRFAKASGRKNVRGTDRRRRLQTETLEDRTMMAVSVATGPTLPSESLPDNLAAMVQPANAILDPDGTLKVYGTANDDDIKITDEFIQFEQWSPMGTPAIQVTIKDNNGQTLLSQAFMLPEYLAITNIEVYAGDGDDMVENNTNLASILFGGAGNDTLYGGFSDDQLWGQDGNDGLFGGGGGIDTIETGQGDDRVLVYLGVSDYLWPNDGDPQLTVVAFADSPATSSDIDGYAQPLTFEAGQWSIHEIKTIDQAMKFVHHSQGNTKLLIEAGVANYDYTTIHRVGYQNPHVSNVTRTAWNDGSGNIYLTNDLFAKGENQVLQTFLHEIGHNWDEENPQWQAFKDISKWTDSNPDNFLPNFNYAQSGDGNWWHHTTATFAREYGQKNPMEDFATAFSAYFMHEMGLPYQGTWQDGNNPIGWSAIPEKIAFIDTWLAGMSPNISALLGNYIDFGRSGGSDADADSNTRSSDTKEATYDRIAASDTLLASGDSSTAVDSYDTTADWSRESLASRASTDKSLPEIVDLALLELLDEDATAEEEFTTLRSPLASR